MGERKNVTTKESSGKFHAILKFHLSKSKQKQDDTYNLLVFTVKTNLLRRCVKILLLTELIKSSLLLDVGNRNHLKTISKYIKPVSNNIHLIKNNIIHKCVHTGQNN